MSKATKNKKDEVSVELQNIDFPIVAIGASAGGLDAISEFLKHLSPTTGMAYIFLQHLSPDRDSMLLPLLSQLTSMEVKEVSNKEHIKPDTFYIIPPDKEVNVENAQILLSPRPESPRFNYPIDILFTSLSDNYKEQVIGIILSGSATDGTIGMRLIKGEGGITFAQDNSAKFDSMPKSAISEGIVDYVLSPKEIAEKLSDLNEHPLGKNLNGNTEELIDGENPDFKEILKKLNHSIGVDFSAYKFKTIQRRILRRMLVLKINDIKSYLNLINEESEEIDLLYRDLLINVTSFFRDPEIYSYLENTLFPNLIKSKSDDETLRIWVPACSTGEEVYSIAILFFEILEKNKRNIKVQLFATDLSEKAIKKARLGIYTKNELKSMSPERFQRFFTKNNGDFQISKSIRENCIFATHNVIKDPPFSKIDLISCRNLFIYLDNTVQRKVLETFHFALNNSGILMLGKAEAISSSTSLFSEINKKFKIYARKKGSENNTFPLPNFKSSNKRDEKDSKSSKNNNKSESKTSLSNKMSKNRNLDEAIDDILISNFLPPSVIINQNGEIIQFRGNTDLYFSHTSGRASLSLLKLVRKEIAFHLRCLISKSLKTDQRVRKDGISVKINDIGYIISLEVAPLKLDMEEEFMLVVFSHHEQMDVFQDTEGNKDDESSLNKLKDRKLHQLEEDLIAAQKDSSDLAQEQERYIEELQSANEEVVSSNEELQTVNEELETSKEELESSNEELITTNQELQMRNELLLESYEYSKAIIATLHEPLVILDKSLRIKTTNKAFLELFNLKKGQTEGRFLLELEDKKWNIPSLRELLIHIIPENSSFHNFKITHDFPRIGEKSFLLNASKIIQKSHGEHLILLSFNDITEAMRVQKKEQDAYTKHIEETKTYNLKLEKAVKERTKQLDLSNQSLADKNNELGRINKELESFAYISSHDLQEPLRKIQTFVDRILEKEKDNLSANGKNYFRFIQKSANNMQMLIKELLNFTSLNSAERKFEKLPLSELIEDVKSEIKDELEDNKAEIEVQATCEATVIPFQFRQLMINLISNSIKFAKPETPVNIHISSEIVGKANIKTLEELNSEFYCHISFSDNGIGFDQEYDKRIFEVFEKLHSKDDFPGTGIGLAIVKKVVENHNGLISVTSEPNKGTIFDIYIPAKNEQ